MAQEFYARNNREPLPDRLYHAGEDPTYKLLRNEVAKDLTLQVFERMAMQGGVTVPGFYVENLTAQYTHTSPGDLWMEARSKCITQDIEMMVRGAFMRADQPHVTEHTIDFSYKAPQRLFDYVLLALHVYARQHLTWLPHASHVWFTNFLASKVRYTTHILTKQITLTSDVAVNIPLEELKKYRPKRKTDFLHTVPTVTERTQQTTHTE
jgi:hypothetical protein